jgi:hypothetical protein
MQNHWKMFAGIGVAGIVTVGWIFWEPGSHRGPAPQPSAPPQFSGDYGRPTGTKKDTVVHSDQSDQSDSGQIKPRKSKTLPRHHAKPSGSPGADSLPPKPGIAVKAGIPGTQEVPRPDIRPAAADLTMTVPIQAASHEFCRSEPCAANGEQGVLLLGLQVNLASSAGGTTAQWAVGRRSHATPLVYLDVGGSASSSFLSGAGL